MTGTTVEALVSVARTSFPDADYVAPSGVLTVRGDHCSVDRLRIELPPGQFLHFQSLSVLGRDAADLSANATVTASSWHREYGSQFDAARLFAFSAPTGTTIHTGADSPAWVEVSFSEPVDICEVKLRNVKNITASRACGVRISVSSGEQRRVIYDAANREHQLVEMLTAAILQDLGEVDPAVLSLVPIIAQTLFGSYKSARTDFDGLSGLSDEQRVQFRSLMTQAVLESRGLEWTIHGPQRCFRFWSEQEKVRYLNDAVAICDALKGLTPKVCFGFGSALAIVRDGDLIPHDDDLDIIVGFDEDEATSLPAALEIVEQWLRPRGFQVSGNFTAHRHVSRLGHKHLDVFVGLFEGDAISWYPSVRGLLDRDTMYPTSEGTLFGVRCPLPRNPLVYLERVYGPNWRRPDPGFKHSWNRSEYLDLTRRQPETARESS